MLATRLSEDAAARFVSTRPPEPSVDSEVSFRQARKWLKECLSNHRCGHSEGIPYLPDRVLCVQSPLGHPEFRVYESGPGERKERGSYATLSYCWGAPQPQMLTTRNVAASRQAIDTATLPPTIQDAVRVTRALGLAFLWVDSLCILQDDAADKQAQLRQMGNIYAFATVTIRAAGARTCQDGFLRRKPAPAIADYRVPYLAPNAETGTMRLRPWTAATEYEPSAEPANQRAWILQETLLPRRLLSFPSAPHPLQWECGERRAALGGLPLELLAISGFDRAHMRALVADAEFLPPWRLWAQTLQTYTERRLSDPGDVLRGVGGVAALFSGAWRCAYFAGLWEDHVVPGLFWRPWPDGTARRPVDSRATSWPSWSWAACVEPVVHAYLTTPVRTRRFEVLDVVQENGESTVHPGLPGSPAGLNDVAWKGCLRVQGTVKRALGSGRARELRDGDRVIGRPFFDADRANSQEVWCMLVADPRAYDEHHPTGLLLAREADEVYRRLGLFTLTAMEWFESCEMQDLRLV